MPRTTCTDPECLWRPIEIALGDDLAAPMMHMGDAVGPDGETVRLFKHHATRRYLNLAADGDTIRAYRYTGPGHTYERTPLAAAIEHAYRDDPDDWPAARAAARELDRLDDLADRR